MRPIDDFTFQHRMYSRVLLLLFNWTISSELVQVWQMRSVILCNKRICMYVCIISKREHSRINQRVN